MGAAQLKSDLQKIIERIDNEQLLQTVYDFLKQREDSKEGEFWKSLTDEQKKEIYLWYEESENDENLIAWENLKKKYWWKSLSLQGLKKNFDSIVEYIKKNWGDNSAKEFIHKADAIFKILKAQPLIGKVEIEDFNFHPKPEFFTESEEIKSSSYHFLMLGKTQRKSLNDLVG